MAQIMSAILSPAVGVLISPFPIVGLILILLSKKSRSNSLFYMLGWILGNTVVFLIAMFFIGANMQTGNTPGTFAKVIYIILGVLLILCAVKEFQKRPKGDEEPKTPKWFDKMSQINSLGAAGFGLFLSALNPKNALLSISAGVAVGALSLPVNQEIEAAVIYVVIASCSIIIPTICFQIAGKKLDHLLDSLRDWLIRNNAVIMAVLLLMIGLNIIEKAF